LDVLLLFRSVDRVKAPVDSISERLATFQEDREKPEERIGSKDLIEIQLTA